MKRHCAILFSWRITPERMLQKPTIPVPQRAATLNHLPKAHRPVDEFIKLLILAIRHKSHRNPKPMPLPVAPPTDHHQVFQLRVIPILAIKKVMRLKMPLLSLTVLTPLHPSLLAGTQLNPEISLQKLPVFLLACHLRNSSTIQPQKSTAFST